VDKKRLYKKIEHVEKLHNRRIISDCAYDVLDTCYRVSGGLLNIEDVEEIFLDRENRR
jgi:hypothetical protein